MATPLITETPRKDGFTGTIPDFIDWIKDQLEYGGVRVHEPVLDEFGRRPTRRVEFYTSGWSEDEALLARVFNRVGSLFSIMFWESTHNGGLYVYEIPVCHFTSEDVVNWLEPASNNEVIARLPQASVLEVRTQEGNFSVDLPAGAVVNLFEPDEEVHDAVFPTILTINTIDQKPTENHHP